MKKLWILILLNLICLIAACDEVEEIINPEIPNFIDEILPDEIRTDFELPTQQVPYGLKFYMDDILIDDYLIKVPFMYDDVSVIIQMEVSASFKSEIFEKEVVIKGTKTAPDLYITTENETPITSKEVYVSGLLTLETEGNFDLEAVPLQVRGRGNSTWDYPKKPYRLKFEERTSILGMKPARDYVLLAEYGDKSFLRNYLAHLMSYDLNIEYTLEMRYVQLYLNDSYEGLYLLIEQVEFDTNRLNVETGEALNAFMLEMDVYERLGENAQENVDYVTFLGRPFTVVEPNLGIFSYQVAQAKSTYIKSYLEAMYQSLSTPGYDFYLDIDQFIDYFIIQEFSKNVDVNFSSVFMYKTDDGRLKFGPLWDFDIAFGNGDYFDYQPQGFRAADLSTFLNKLLDNPLFKVRYIERFKEVLELYHEKWLEGLNQMYLRLYDDAVVNFQKWDRLGQYDWPNPPEMVAANTYQAQVEYLRLWYQYRVLWLRDNIDGL